MNSERKWHLERGIQSARDSCHRLCGDGEVSRVCSGHLQIIHLKLARLGGWNGRDLIGGWHAKTKTPRIGHQSPSEMWHLCEQHLSSPTHQTLHRHPRSSPTALCCLTLSGYRCHRTKMASFQLVPWLFHLKCQSKSRNRGGLVSEGPTCHGALWRIWRCDL